MGIYYLPGDKVSKSTFCKMNRPDGIGCLNNIYLIKLLLVLKIEGLVAFHAGPLFLF